MVERKLHEQSILNARSLWHKKEEHVREMGIAKAGRLAERINEANMKGKFSDIDEGVRLMNEELDRLLEGEDIKLFCDAMVFYSGAEDLKEKTKKMWYGTLPLLSPWGIIVNRN
jgi:hypothetical protein